MSGLFDKPGAPRRPPDPRGQAPRPPQRPHVPQPQGHTTGHSGPHPAHYGAGQHVPGQQASGQAHRAAEAEQPFAPDYAEFYADEPITIPATARTTPADAAALEQEQRELVAHARDEAAAELRQTPVVPPGSVTGRSLTLVVSIMCFLACLTAGAVYMINESAAAWLRDIASEVTVQIEPRERLDIEKAVRDVSGFLARQPGVVAARPMSVEDSASLLEPWLGQTDALKSLPMPRLIAVELDRNAPPDFAGLRELLTKQFPAATLDDHRQWQQQIRAVTRSFALGGIAILLLVGAATTAIIISATRSAMASNREIIEVLHYVGATDRFIAREFERSFLHLGIRAGLVGALCSMAVFLAMPLVMQALGGGSVTQAEMTRLLGSGSLDLKGYLLLMGLVVVIAALCMLTSRFGVKRILRSQQ